MALKIEPVAKELLEAEFGTDSSGNDPETVKYIRSLGIGEGFKVTADGTETDRMVKRRINACAKESYRELEWHSVEGSKILTARIKAIDTDAEKKDAEERLAREKAEAESKKEPEKAPESPPAADGKAPESQGAPREPAGTAGARK